MDEILTRRILWLFESVHLPKVVLTHLFNSIYLIHTYLICSQAKLAMLDQCNAYYKGILIGGILLGHTKWHSL